MNSLTLLLATANEALIAELSHIAAICGLELIVAEADVDIRRHARSARILAVDQPFAHLVAETRPPGTLFLVCKDPGPINWELASAIDADGAFTLPAMAGDLLTAVSAALGGASARTATPPTPVPARPAPTKSASRGPSTSRPVTSVPAHPVPAAHRPATPAPVGPGLVIGVIGACGGAGASTVAAGLALTAPEPAFLVDAVPCSGGLDLMLGVEESPGARWEDFTTSSDLSLLDAARLQEACPARGNVAVLTASRSTHPQLVTVEDVLPVVQAHIAGVSIVDLSPWSDYTAEIARACDEIVLVTPPEVRPVAAAAHAVAFAQAARLNVHVVARYRSWSSMSPSEMADVIGTDITVEIPRIGSLARTCEYEGLNRLPRQLSKPLVELWTHLTPPTALTAVSPTGTTRPTGVSRSAGIIQPTRATGATRGRWHRVQAAA